MKEQLASHYPLTRLRVVLLLLFIATIAFASGLILAPYLTGVVWAAPMLQLAPLAQAPAQPARLSAESKMEEEVLTAYENALIKVYEKAVPSVVRIDVTLKVNQTSSFDVEPDAPSSPVSPHPLDPGNSPRQAHGSGFVWDKAGHIVTNFHVVQGAERIEVTFMDGVSVEAEVLGTDLNTDLAVLKVAQSATSLQPVTLGDSASLKVGQLTLTIGTPFGQEFTLTSGIISAVGRTIRSCDSCYPIAEAIQTDTPINPGSSGSPLLNQRGEVIGVITWIISRSGGNAGVAFAAPSNIVKQMVPALINGND